MMTSLRRGLSFLPMEWAKVPRSPHESRHVEASKTGELNASGQGVKSTRRASSSSVQAPILRPDGGDVPNGRKSTPICLHSGSNDLESRHDLKTGLPSSLRRGQPVAPRRWSLELRHSLAARIHRPRLDHDDVSHSQRRCPS